MQLSMEQVEALAPDSGTLKRAMKLARAKNFTDIGCTERAVWAVAIGSSSYDTCVDLQGPAYRCSCPVLRAPCKHALGLLALVAGNPALAQPCEPPETHATWLQKRDSTAKAKATKASGQVKDPEARARRAEQREKHVARGIDELKRFLEDTVRLGLADTAQRTGDVWDQVQRRLIDAQARGLSNYLGWIRGQIGAGGDWTERVFYALARLHLIVSAYEHRQQLEPALVEDLKELIGWSRKQDEILSQPAVHGEWLVLNHGTRYESGLYSQSVWLFEPESHRFALALSFATDFNRETLPGGYDPGTLTRAAVHFHSRHLPLRASVVRDNAFERSLPNDLDCLDAVTHPDLESAVRAVQDIRAGSPLLVEWPLLVDGLRPVLKDKQLALADRHGRLVLVDREYLQKWQFLAVIGPGSAVVFMTYNGFYARPWAIRRGNEWIALDMDESGDG